MGNFDITNSKSQKLLGVKFDHKLPFDDHILELCKRASRKIHALSREASQINISKRRILLNAFFKSQFTYCPLVWMCHQSRANNGEINRLHKRCFRIIYSDKQLSFETLLEKDGSVSVHNQNLQILATDMHKIKNDLSPLSVTEVFEQRNEQHYDLRKNSQFTIPPIRTVYHGQESISFIGPKIWNIIPDRLKNANNIEAFKMQIKKWKSENCPCRLCKVTVQNVSFFKSISIEGEERKISCEI